MTTIQVSAEGSSAIHIGVLTYQTRHLGTITPWPATMTLLTSSVPHLVEKPLPAVFIGDLDLLDKVGWN